MWTIRKALFKIIDTTIENIKAFYVTNQSIKLYKIKEQLPAPLLVDMIKNNIYLL